MYLLDTNVISELRKVADGKADARVTDWFSHVESTRTYLSVITLMELDIGILRVERRDTAQDQRLRAWFEHRVVPEFADRTLSIQLNGVRSDLISEPPQPKRNPVRLTPQARMPPPKTTRSRVIGAGLGYYSYTYVTAHRLSLATLFLLTSAVTIFLIGLVSAQITQLIYKDSN